MSDVVKGLNIDEAWECLNNNYPSGTIDDDPEWADEMIDYLTETPVSEYFIGMVDTYREKH